MNLKKIPAKLWESFTFVGLIFATLFFAASLTPSLLPRIYIVQGVLSGFAIAVGYGVGVFFVWIWNYLQFPKLNQATQTIGKRLATITATTIAVVFLWRATVWQNSIRELMEMEPIASADPWRIAAIAIVLGIVLVVASRIFWWCCSWFADKLNLILPKRVSYIISTLAVGVFFLLIANDVVAKFALRVADAAFLKMDEFKDDHLAQPLNRLASGSESSLISWDSIGKKGKDFIVNGPTQNQISEFTGSESLQPIRVYVGFRTCETPEERAKLALAELKRVGAFDRSLLVVATPTGTGWLEPASVDPLEYLHGGDTAIVSTQYSYLPSWITILVDPDRSKVSAHALFTEVYNYWKTLPKSSRPKLYLQGLSLGSLGSETCADLFTLFEDPIQGAVWSGPPFPSTNWSYLTEHRNADSPQWLPTFRDGEMVRFTARENAIDDHGDHWGPMRFVYIQHASDPMVFFSPDLLFNEPDWLVGKRGPDVSPYLKWYPIVTFLQTGFDIPMATTVPTGYGHNYSASSYIDAWIAVTSPSNWTDEDTTRLKELFKKKSQK